MAPIGWAAAVGLLGSVIVAIVLLDVGRVWLSSSGGVTDQRLC